MSHFSRFQKASERLVKDGNFYSGDDGGQDAGAGGSNTMMVSPSVGGHLRDIGDRHEREADLHSAIAQQTGTAGMDKRSNEHQQIADQHKAAAVHYRAAANAMNGTEDTAAAAPHLKQARACAGQAAELCKCGMS